METKDDHEPDPFEPAFEPAFVPDPSDPEPPDPSDPRDPSDPPEPPDRRPGPELPWSPPAVAAPSDRLPLAGAVACRGDAFGAAAERPPLLVGAGFVDFGTRARGRPVPDPSAASDPALEP